jgi:sterol desaturase/sphingolipid hydroxylase (fatty acid hydroxylase superfamily)
VTAESISAIEPWIRAGVFAAVFLLVAVWEARKPRRARRFHRLRRWPHNFALFALDIVVVRILAPGAAVAVALAAEKHGAGLLNVLGVAPLWAVLAGFAGLDLAVYGQHVLFHRVPALWRLHRVHHSDPDFDVTTAGRFHPVEIVLSLGIKCAAIAILGAPWLAVLAFEAVLNAAAMFNHSNGRLPVVIDRWLRWMLVTPDMHRVHHSVVKAEMNSNFGFNLSWWDRLFGTYRDQPAQGHAAMRIGVNGLDAPEEITLGRLLTQPLRAPLYEKSGLLYKDTASKDYEVLRSSINSGGKS